MLDKRGQITLFIILGFVLLIVGLFLYFVATEEEGYDLQKESNFQNQVSAIKFYVSRCLEDESSFALFVLGMQGGNIDLPAYHFSSKSFDTSYLYFNGDSKLPSIEEIEEQLSDYITTNIHDCADFSKFNNVDIVEDEINIETVLGYNDVRFRMNWPLTIKQGTLASQISDFSVTTPVRFLSIYRIIQNIINATKIHPEVIDTFNLLNQNTTRIDFVIFNDDTVLYLIVDNQSRLNVGQPYTFLFATNISINKSKNKAPKLGDIPTLVGIKGNLFTYDVDAIDFDNDTLTYSLLSPLFDINPNNGLINFTPTDFHIGIHFVKISVNDGLNSDSAIVKFMILDADNTTKRS